MPKFDLMRSFLYVPAYNDKYLNSSFQTEADVIILDLEDSVPYLQKSTARRNLSKLEHTFKGQTVVRLNSLEEIDEVAEDLKAINLSLIDGFMLPKINCVEDILKYEKLIETELESTQFYLVILIETAKVMFHLQEIVQHPKVKVLAFGGEDYITDLHGKHGKSRTIFEYARAQIVLAARAYGKLCIDTPFLALDDYVTFVAETENANELGFDGKQCIHPNQLNRVNQIFTPDEIEYEQAKKLIANINIAKEEGKGVTIFNGKMIGPPMVKRAQNVIKLFEGIQKKRNYLRK